jgi:hypothetical protein
VEPQQRITRTAQLAEKAGASEDAIRGLVELSDNFKALPVPESPDAELTDAFLNKQLESIRGFSTEREPNPKGLAEALAIAAVTAS